MKNNKNVIRSANQRRVSFYPVRVLIQENLIINSHFLKILLYMFYVKFKFPVNVGVILLLAKHLHNLNVVIN